MDLFLKRNHVPEYAKLRIALSYLDGGAPTWRTMSSGERERTRDWRSFKATLLEQCGERDIGTAMERLRKVQQTGSV